MKYLSVLVLPRKQWIQSCQFLSVIASVVLSNISQYTLKPEHLTTLSRTPTNKKKWSHLLKYETVVLYCLASGNLWTLSALQMPFPLFWCLKTIQAGMETIRHMNVNFFILMGPIAFFLLFCCMVIFHQDVNLTFNKLCERLRCCGGIAPIRLTADPLAGPLSP